MRLHFLTFILFTYSLSVYADFEKTLSSLEVWANACEGHADCERLKREFNELKTHLTAPCIGEHPLSTHHVNSDFETSLKEALDLKKDFKDWSLKELSNLILCMNNNTPAWKKECKKKSPAPYSASCATDAKKTIQINLDNGCEKLFVETDIHLGQGTFNEARTALEYRPQTPHWIQVVHRKPLPLVIPELPEDLLEDEKAEILSTYTQEHEEQLRKLEKEIKIQKSLPQSPTLVGILGQYGPHETYLPRYDGGDAMSVIFEQEPKPFVAEQVLRTTGHGIEKMHNERWIHRDLKWENVFVNHPDDAFKTLGAVGDFGYTFKFKDNSKGKEPNTVGTGGYMAPEQFEPEIKGRNNSEKTVNAQRADVFSFGIMTTLRLGIANNDLMDFGDCQEAGKKSCSKYLTRAVEKIKESKFGKLPIGVTLVEALASRPELRPDIGKLRKAVDIYTRDQFDSLFAPIAKNYSSRPEVQRKLIEEQGYAVVPFEDRETGALRLGLKLRGSKDLIEIKNNPLVDQKSFNDELRSLRSK